jgi:hypothetical protein
MNIEISNKILDDFVLINHEYLVDSNYYNEKSGIQEYHLYSYLSTFFSNTVILDIGTFTGRSAVALSHNLSNKVLSYDIMNYINNPSHCIYTKSNIEFHIKDVINDLTPEFIKNVKIIIIDIDHFETIESKILQKLRDIKFSGIILLDDITKHPDPIILYHMYKLWTNIPEEKYDITKYGHWSGTGLIIMNSDIKFTFT